MASFAPRYAHAFAEVAESAGLDANVAQQQMQDFADSLDGSLELREFLGNPSVSISQKLKIVDAMAGKIGMTSQVRNFIAVILEHDRLGDLTEILAAYGQVVDQHASSAEAMITSAYALNEEDKALLETQVSKLAGGARVKASYAQDATLLGGAVVQIGSTIYDGSVRAQLQQLKHKLASA